MSAPLIAGVELGGTKCNCILATGPDDIRDEVRIPTTTPEQTLSAIEQVLDRWKGFDAMGIGSFGPVSIDRGSDTYGFITATPKAGWTNTDVAVRLSSRTGVPTGFNSDVAGAALGEGKWGAAQGLADHAYITVGTGVGVGLVMRGEPTSGMTHPELGHLRTTRLAGDDWPGICTFHGDCVEGMASGPAIERRSGIAAPDMPTDHPAWANVAHTLAQLLHTLVLTGIPRRIVMGGGVMTGMPHLFPMIRTRLVESLGGYGASGDIAPVEDYVVPAALGNNAGPLGAIVLGRRALGLDTL